MSTNDKAGGLAVYKWLALSLLILVLDQITKQLIVDNMTLYERIEILPFFNLFYIHNLGAAFGFLSDQPGWQRWFLSIITTLVSLGILFWLTRLKSSQKLLIIALVFVLGGALGNLYDRVVFGYVIDFIDWHAFGYHWPSFNIADMAISIGALLLIIDSFVNPDEG
ncbi:MAG: signal peptidase II [Gammaproteobacteria bacterium]|nr:MAG: signal peptidase II [Gammaproteobacteria bacterium]